jgi:RNA polymerase subunit RPABC4/transcription elongation factor Spt4
MNYNKEEVESCKNCHSLYIVDEKGFPFCKSCGTINFTEYSSIETYIDKYGVK